jgi:hypothetical protein
LPSFIDRQFKEKFSRLAKSRRTPSRHGDHAFRSRESLHSSIDPIRRTDGRPSIPVSH